MLGRLHRRLTALFTALTALVLSAAVAFAGSLAYRQQRRSEDSLRQAAFAAIQDRLLGSNTVSDGWLTKQQAENDCILYLEDQGSPLAFCSAPGPHTALTARAKALFLQAQVQGQVTQGQPYAFLVQDDAGMGYRGLAALLPAPTGQAQGVLLVLLQSQARSARQLRRLVLSYGGVWALSVLLLGGIGWRLVGLALQPTQKALRQQNEFVAAASHELRSPLTVIKASLEAAQEGDGAQCARFLAIAQGETERMRRLTEDLLLLAGQDANVWHSDLAPLELDTLCIELYEAYRLPARQRGHTLALRLPEQRFPAVQGDRQRVEQLFAILLHNAMEYAPAGTPIELTARVLPRGVWVAVIDHGPGVPDESKQAVFQRFMRGDKSRTDRAHFGLGLSVAQEIAALHHARLWVEDTPGGGATFTVAFPLR